MRGGEGTDEVDECCRLLVAVAVGERVRAAVVLPRAPHAAAETRAAPSGGRGTAEATALHPLHLGDERRLHFRHRSTLKGTNANGDLERRAKSGIKVLDFHSSKRKWKRERGWG